MKIAAVMHRGSRAAAITIGVVALLTAGCGSLPPDYANLQAHQCSTLYVGGDLTERFELPGHCPDTVVCIPGFPGSALDFAALAGELNARGLHVIVLNPPGHGSMAPEGDGPGDMSDYGTWLVKALAEIGLTDPRGLCLVAHSAGSEMVVQALMAQRLGHAADSLVFINPWMPTACNTPISWGFFDCAAARLWTWITYGTGWMFQGFTYDQLFFDQDSASVNDFKEAHEWSWRFADCMHETSRIQRDVLDAGDDYTRLASAAFEALAAARYRKTPVLVLNSAPGADQTIPDAYKGPLQPELSEMFPGAIFKIIPGGGHMLQIEASQSVADAISEFISRSH